MVEDLHAAGQIQFLSDHEADLAEADDAEGTATGVMGCGWDIVMSVEEDFLGEGAGGGSGLAHIAEDGDDVVEGRVTDGLGGGTRTVAVENPCSDTKLA